MLEVHKSGVRESKRCWLPSNYFLTLYKPVIKSKDGNKKYLGEKSNIWPFDFIAIPNIKARSSFVFVK